MLELLVKAHMEDRRREIAECMRGAEAARIARPSGASRVHWFTRAMRRGQRANRASSSAFTAGHSASTIE